MIPWWAITFSKVYDKGFAWVDASASVAGVKAKSDIKKVEAGTAFFDVDWVPLKRQAAERLREKLLKEEFDSLDEPVTWDGLKERRFYEWLADKMGVDRKGAKLAFNEWYYERKADLPPSIEGGEE